MRLFFRSVFIVIFAFASNTASAGSDFSAQGVSLGMSRQEVDGVLGSTYSLHEGADTHDSSSLILVGTDGKKSYFALYFLNDHLIYMLYAIWYPTVAERPNYADYKKATQDKYGPITTDYPSNWTWVYEPNGVLPSTPPGPAHGPCSVAPGGLTLQISQSDGTNLPLPTTVPARCYRQVHADLSTNGPTVTFYRVSIWDQKAMFDYLSNRAEREKREAESANAAAAAAASKNKPHL